MTSTTPTPDQPATVTVVIAFDPDPAQHGTLREVSPAQAKLMVREGRARLADDADKAALAAAAEQAPPDSGEPAPTPATRSGRRAAAASAAAPAGEPAGPAE